MDYILFGMGFGASLMLVGWALRTFGPGWKYAGVTDDRDPHLYVCKRFWNRFVQGLGGVLAIAGSATVLLTFLVMLSNPDDDTGTMFSLVIWIFICLIVLGWCLTYLSHYGCTGIWSREEGYGFGVGSHVESTRKGSLRSRRVSRDTPVVVASIAPADFEQSAPSAPDTELGHVDVSDQFVEADEPEVRDDDALDTDPEYDFGDSTDLTVPAEPISREIRMQD